jgi:hypothetical protein
MDTIIHLTINLKFSNMKKLLLFLTTLLLLATVRWANATNEIDIGLYSTSCSDFEVRLSSAYNITGTSLTNIQFAVKYPADVTLGDITYTYPVGLQYTTTVGSDKYSVFVGENVAINDWVSGTQYTLLSFSADHASTSSLTLTIGNDTWTSNNNAMYYAELLGINKTGSILTGATVTLRVHNTDLGRYYCKIQEAIDDASTNNTIVASAGNYYEDIVANKKLNILGAKNGIDGCNVARGTGESVIYPLTNNPDPYSPTATRIFLITASGVVIDGFTINGDDPGVSGDYNACYGISAESGQANLDIKNNIVLNLPFIGIYLCNDAGGAMTSGNQVRNNKIDNMSPTSGFGIGVYTGNNTYTDIKDNCMTNVRKGIQGGENFYYANTGNVNPVWSGNTITSYKIGIWNNLAYGAATPVIITGNEIYTVIGSTINSGIEISSIGQDASVNVTNNTVTGAMAGINLWSNPTYTPLEIGTNTFIDCSYGVFANNFDGYNSNGSTSAYVIDGVIITNPGNAGVYVKDNSLNTNGATVSVDIKGNTVINGTAVGLAAFRLEGAGASLSFSGTAPQATVTGAPKYFVLQTSTVDVPAGNIDATQVMLGGNYGSGMTLATLFATEDKIDHKIDYYSLGFVKVKDLHTYVTVNSYVAPNTTPSIQRGVDAAGTPGWTVNIADGLYKESNITLNKPLTIDGQTKTGVILAPSIADSKENSSFGATYSYGFLLGSGNILIKDLTIDGNANGALGDHIFRGGVMTDHRIVAMFNNLTVENVIVQHTYRRGIQMLSGVHTANSTGHIITGSTVSDVILGPAIDVFDGDVAITNNVISAVPAGSGIEVVQYYGPGSINSIIRGNSISNVLTGIQTVWSSATSFIGGPNPADRNTITLSGANYDIGIIFRNADGGSTVQNNLVTGSVQDAGIWMYDDGEVSNPVLIKDNVLNSTSSTSLYWGYANGVFMTDDGNDFFTPGNANLACYASITGNIITGFQTGVGLLAFGSPSLALVSTTIENNEITGGSTGVFLYDDDGATGGCSSQAIIHSNNLGGNSTWGIDASTLVGTTIDATCNWWGTNTVAGVSAEVNGPVDYDPWLINGSDIGDPGFIPGATCTGATDLYVNDGVYDGDDIYTTAIGNDANEGTSAAPFLTITKAVTTAVDGTSIMVDAGTFQEQVSVAKTLNVTGVDKTKTTIKAPVTMIPVQISIWSLNENINPVFFANGNSNTVNISKVTIDGDGGRSVNKFFGSLYYEANGVFDNNRITSIHDAGTFSGAQQGIAYYGGHIRTVTMAQMLSVTNNLIDDYQKGGVVVDAPGTNGNITGNYIIGQNVPLVTAQNGIQLSRGATGTINGNIVTNNIWNKVEHPHEYTAAGILLYQAASVTSVSGNTLTGNECAISSSGSTGVTYGVNTFSNNKIHLWLDAAVDVNPANVYDKRVDNPAITEAVFGCIQYGIDEAASDNTLNASAGTFAENVIVHTSVSIFGPQSAVSGCDPSRGTGEAVVVPAVSDVYGEIFHVTASNVSIIGFTIDGDNPLLPVNGYGFGGADMHAAEGVTVYVTGINNLNVTNNVIKNLLYFGVTLYDYPAGVPSSGHVISYNKFQDLGTYDPASTMDYWGGGVLLYNNQYTEVSNNCMVNVRLGVQTGNFYQTNPGASSCQLITANTMETRRTGVFHNLHYSSASAITLSNNTITALANANETRWDGIALSSLSVPSYSTNNIINGNGLTFTNLSKGYEVWNVKNTYPASVSGGSVSGVDYGVFANNFEGYSSNGPDGAHAVISGMTITPKSGGKGIYALDSPSYTGSATTIEVEVTNNLITGGANGIVMAENHSGWVDAEIHDNNISGNSSYGILSTVSDAVNATCNWWGSADINVVKAEVSGSNVDYLPYLTSNACTPSTYGFYPTGTCVAPLSLKVMLQGPYNSGTGQMNTDLNTLLPSTQPYNTLPWNYTGTETLPSPLSADVVDWVLVQLRDDDGITVVKTAAGLLYKNGTVIANFDDLDQFAEYHIVIFQRNHMPVMSKNPIVVSSYTFPYDFTVLANLYGTNPAINLGSGVYGMIAGDVTKNGMLKYSGPNNDRGPIIAKIVAETGSNNINGFTSAGYWQEDVTMNSIVLYLGTGNDRGPIQSNLNILTGFPYLNNTYTSVVPGAYTGGKDGSNDGPVDIQFAESAENLEIEIITNELITNGMVDNIQFTLAWKAGDIEIEQLLSTFASGFNLLAQGDVVEVDGTNYLVFVSVTPTYLPQAWNSGEQLTVMTFEKEYGQLISNRLWIADNDFTVSNNGEYYLSNWGTDVTGIIYTSTVGIETAEAGFVKMYPNPVTSGSLFLKVSLAQSENIETQIWDITGKLIKKLDYQTVAGTMTLTVDVSEFNSGVYLINVIGDKVLYKDRFVVK